ncbi:hypothetical protein [Bernardetia sp. MNP-M8]|uniref:hypothetical protein n=1 Tax=Bernardetia sp. MNP-M8 TaxID=3127470 RepID=UPI0030D5F485
MKSKIPFYALLFFNSSYIVIVILVMIGKMTFGYGLGDLFYIGLVAVSLIMNTFYLLIYKKRLNIIALINLCLFLYYILNLTVMRGVENPWNGSLFI